MLTKITFAYHTPMSQGSVVRPNIIPRLIMSENISDEFRISSPYSLLRKPFLYMSKSISKSWFTFYLEEIISAFSIYIA